MIKMVEVRKIIPYENNPRHNSRAIKPLCESIRRFGFKVPIVLDRDNVIVCGHTRLKAALKLGMKEVPCVIADDLTPEQIKAFRLVDNKTAELSQWNTEALDRELEILGEAMEGLGFDQKINGLGNLEEGRELDILMEGEFEFRCPSCGFEFNERG